MKRRLAALAALLLVAGVLLAASPPTSDMLSSSLGVVNYQTNYDRTSVLSVTPLNYSHLEVSLVQGGSLALSVVANPGDVDVLVMNQGNFSLWAKGGGTSYSTYPQSRLEVANYSFVIGSPSKANFFVVFVSHSSSQNTQVLTHEVVTSPSQLENFFLPVVLGGVGLILMAYALRGKRAKPGKAAPLPAETPAPPAETGPSPVVAFCKHCGVTLEQGNSFCPSCGKSQD